MSDPLSYTVRVVHFPYTPQAFQALMGHARRHHVNRQGRYLPSDQQIDIWSHPWDVRGSRRLGQLRVLLTPSEPPELQSLVCEHAT
jgi:hypothetical protein